MAAPCICCTASSMPSAATWITTQISALKYCPELSPIRHWPWYIPVVAGDRSVLAVLVEVEAGLLHPAHLAEELLIDR